MEKENLGNSSNRGKSSCDELCGVLMPYLARTRHALNVKGRDEKRRGRKLAHRENLPTQGHNHREGRGRWGGGKGDRRGRVETAMWISPCRCQCKGFLSNAARQQEYLPTSWKRNDAIRLLGANVFGGDSTNDARCVWRYSCQQ